MKLLLRRLRPFAAPVLVCLLLLFGQAICDLALPSLMSDMVNVGIQQGGVETGAPEAVSRQGMELLCLFLPQGDRERTEAAYRTVEPESSLSRQLSSRYPLAAEREICVLREDLEDGDREALDSAYSRAAYAFLLTLQKLREPEAPAESPAGSGGSPAASAQPPSPAASPEAGGLPSQAPEEASRPEFSQPEITEDSDGYLGKVPEGALFGPIKGVSASRPAARGMLFRMPLTAGKQSAGPEEIKEILAEDAEGEGEPLSPAGDREKEQEGDLSEGIAQLEAGQLYAMVPLLQSAPKSVLAEAVDRAGESASLMGGQVGAALKKLFYRELGLDVDAMQRQYIGNTGLRMLGVALLGVVTAVLVGFFSSRVAARLGRDLRRDLFQKVESFSGGELDRFSTASLITRTTNDVQQMQMMVTAGLRMVCYAPIMGVGGVVMAIRKSVSMSWIVAAAVAVLTGLILVALGVALPRFKALQKLIDRLNLVSREALSGMLVVRAFGNEAREEQRFEQANRELAETNRFVQRVLAVMMPAMTLVMNVMSLVIVWVGGRAIARSTLQIGDMMAFLQYAMQIIGAFLMIAVMFVFLPRATVSAGRIAEVLETEPEIRDPETPVVLEKIRGKLEFKDVSFRYGGAETDVLEHLSFTAEPGKTTAIIGATGSGKSTLLSLIPRFYDVTGGAIELDGVDIRKLSLQALRGAIGYVPQKSLLFSGDIPENIRWGREDASDEEVAEAMETAQAEAFAETVAQGGGNLSGGQRQRLAIARALVRKPAVYLFDDSFSALDFQTDAALRKSLKERTEGAAVIIVAQRVSTILHAEQILVLDEGKIVGRGVHEELMRTCPEYREIAESQLRQ